MLQETASLWALVPGLLLVFLGIFLFIATMIADAAIGERRRVSRCDTPQKAIRRERERYVSGEISLEKFEDRVYQMVDVDDSEEVSA